MENLLYFTETEDFMDFMYDNDGQLQYPLVVYKEDTDMVEYLEKSPSHIPFYVEAIDELTITTNFDLYEYSFDLETWKPLQKDVESPTINANVKLYLRLGVDKTLPSSFLSPENIITMSMSGLCNLGGNAASLVLHPQDFPHLSYNAYGRYPSFIGCPIVDASKMELPLRELSYPTYDSGTSYAEMFKDCKQLISAPELPAIIVDESSYLRMFSGCSALKNAPKVIPVAYVTGDHVQYHGGSCEEMFKDCTSLVNTPAMSLKTVDFRGCKNMFMGCTSLRDASNINLGNIDEDACLGMFANCANLVEPPIINALIVGEMGCESMFEGCSSLKSFQQVLPATVLGEAAYSGMFANCTSLVAAPKLPCENLTEACYYGMFSGCTSLKVVPTFSITAVPDEYDIFTNMFQGCSNLDYIKFMAHTIAEPEDIMHKWLDGVSTTGTFVKSVNATWDTEGIVPEGWTVVTE